MAIRINARYIVRRDFFDPSENIKLPDINYEILLIAPESSRTAAIHFHEILRCFNYVTTMLSAFPFVALAVITYVVKQSC